MLITNRRPRVVESHRLVRFSFVVAGLFALVGIGWSLAILANGGSWWGPLHAFLVGTVVAAISGTTQMFTITWSASAPPPRLMSTSQGATLITGSSLVLVGVGFSSTLATWIGGALIVASLLLLATILVWTIRHSLLRRFDLSVRFYLLAIACGVVGVSLGAAMASGMVGGEAYTLLRITHLHLNLVGLVGFTILGTVPTLLPTFAHQNRVSGREAIVSWWLCLGAAIAIAGGVFTPIAVGVGVVVAAVATSLLVGGILVRLERRESRETLPLLQVVAGIFWIVVWAFVDGVTLLAGMHTPLFARWTIVVVTVGIGQVLFGSVAYLLPVVLGPPIGENLRRMGHLPVVPLVAANLAGLLLVLGQPRAAGIAGLIWLLDLTRRLVTLRKPSRQVASQPAPKMG